MGRYTRGKATREEGRRREPALLTVFMAERPSTCQAAAASSGHASGASSQELAIRRILRAANHFDMLQLKRPHADLMEKPVWDITPEQVHKAFRKLSLCCHPDKSTHPDAPRAFEQLKKAKQCLSNELDRDDYLIDFVKQQRVSWEGNWSTVEAVGETKQRVSSMRDEALRSESENVADAMREKREKAEAAARKKQRLQQAAQRRAARREEDDNDGFEVSDDDEDGGGSGSTGRDAPLPGPQRPGGPSRPLHHRPGASGNGGARKKPKFM